MEFGIWNAGAIKRSLRISLKFEYGWNWRSCIIYCTTSPIRKLNRKIEGSEFCHKIFANRRFWFGWRKSTIWLQYWRGSFHQRATSCKVNIWKHPEFEAAIVKVQRFDSENLLEPKKEELSGSQIEIKRVALKCVRNCPLQAEIWKSHGYSSQKGMYVNLSFLRPTSTLRKCVFSETKYALSEFWKRILPANFESQIISHINRSLWTVDDVTKALNSFNWIALNTLNYSDVSFRMSSSRNSLILKHVPRNSS